MLIKCRGWDGWAVNEFAPKGGAVDAYGTSSGVGDRRHSSAGERSATQSVSESTDGRVP